eukprot:CAMPEP_0119015472 /NCGR_PEP_ID=MMETSP1176-20130426/11096_1 /TAXON_ID=265551 /ORGANISM="Synedropsis recta cf, Strain CCMP1620" /LENGTH=190 /DNA_ID=CAMNT_0006968767 /DNA_START=114 /DNA_END=689 /DNA_ORIENTATION=-
MVGTQLCRASRNHASVSVMRSTRAHHQPRSFDGFPAGSSFTRSFKRVFSEGKPQPKVEKVVETAKQTMLQRWMGPKEMPTKGSFQWYREMVLLCTVFAITGSSTMFLVRPAMSEGLGLKGSFRDGPWSYRIGSVVIMTPLYAALLVVVGTTFGRHTYFRHFAVKMFSRFGIPPEAMDSTFHETAKNFRKW